MTTSTDVGRGAECAESHQYEEDLRVGVANSLWIEETLGEQVLVFRGFKPKQVIDV